MTWLLTGTAGLTILLPALLAALFAPLVVIASGGMDRRMILCGLLFAYGLAGIVGNFLTGNVAARRSMLTLTTIALRPGINVIICCGIIFVAGAYSIGREAASKARKPVEELDSAEPSEVVR